MTKFKLHAAVCRNCYWFEVRLRVVYEGQWVRCGRVLCS